MKFQFYGKIAFIHEKFLVLLKLLRGPNKTRSRAGSGPRAAGCAPLSYNIQEYEMITLYKSGNFSDMKRLL